MGRLAGAVIRLVLSSAESIRHEPSTSHYMPHLRDLFFNDRLPAFMSSLLSTAPELVILLVSLSLSMASNSMRILEAYTSLPEDCRNGFQEQRVGFQMLYS